LIGVMFARIAALAALQTTCCAAGAVLAAPAEQRVAVTYQEGEHVPTRGAIDRAEAAGRAARLCSGDWSLDVDEALHLTLPRPLLHAVQAGEEDAEEYASHSLSVHGVPRDDPYNHLSEQFEVIYLGEDGAVAHRNATPPVRHYLLQSHDSAWEGTFVLTDHMETDHLYGWLNYNPDPATAASQLVVEPVNERETSGYCPPAEVEHVVYLETTLGVTIYHHNDQVSSDSGVASAAARKLLISNASSTDLATNSAAAAAGGDDMVAVPGPSPGASGHKQTKIFPVPPLALLARAAGCYETDINWEADDAAEQDLGGQMVSAMLSATSGMNSRYGGTGIKFKAGQVLVSKASYGNKLNVDMLNKFRSQRRVGKSDVALLATGQNGGGVAGIAYVGTMCGGYNVGLVRASSNMVTVSAHEVGHTWGSDHTTCGDWMGPSGGNSKLCSSTAKFLTQRAAGYSCIKETCDVEQEPEPEPTPEPEPEPDEESPDEGDDDPGDCPYGNPNLCVKNGYPVPPSLVDKAKKKCSEKWCKASSKCFKKWRCEDYGSPN